MKVKFKQISKVKHTFTSLRTEVVEVTESKFSSGSLRLVSSSLRFDCIRARLIDRSLTFPRRTSIIGSHWSRRLSWKAGKKHLQSALKVWRKYPKIEFSETRFIIICVHELAINTSVALRSIWFLTIFLKRLSSFLIFLPTADIGLLCFICHSSIFPFDV